VSNLTDALFGMLSGTVGASRILLHNCRFEGAGTSLYGAEAILELFRTHPLRLEFLEAMQGERTATIFAQDAQGPVALFADLYAGHIARLWYLAPTPLPGDSHERIDVPFDPDFGYLVPSVAFEAADHPELSAAHVTRIAAAAAHLFLAGESAEPIRSRFAPEITHCRPHVLRAFSQGDAAAALMIVTAYRTSDQPGPVQFSAALRLGDDSFRDLLLVVDDGQCARELERSWRPSFVRNL